MIDLKAPSLSSPQKEKIREYFDSIAARYDFANSLLSLGLDEGWRKKSLRQVLDQNQKSILDLGMGTGKFLGGALKYKKWDRAVGLDFSEPMLENARRKLPDGVQYVRGDFHRLPFQEESFDLIISAFALRSVKDMPQFLKENYRVLKKNGRAAFLCLTRPSNFFIRMAYYPYLYFYLPTVGRLVSGDQEAYQFLSQSIRKFQEPEKTAEMMRQAGFERIKVLPFSFGIATLITGEK